jgi:hypothetical protein
VSRHAPAACAWRADDACELADGELDWMAPRCDGGSALRGCVFEAAAGLDEGLLPLTLSDLLYMENPYSYQKCR